MAHGSEIVSRQLCAPQWSPAVSTVRVISLDSPVEVPAAGLTPSQSQSVLICQESKPPPALRMTSVCSDGTAPPWHAEKSTCAAEACISGPTKSRMMSTIRGLFSAHGSATVSWQLYVPHCKPTVSTVSATRLGSLVELPA